MGSERNLLAMDHYVTVAFNATQTNVARQGMTNVPREISAEQITWAGYLIHNNDSAVTWVQVFFKPAIEVQIGITAPDFTIKLGSQESLAWDWLNPIRQGTGFTVAATTTETGSTSVTAATTGVFFFKPRQGARV